MFRAAHVNMNHAHAGHVHQAGPERPAADVVAAPERRVGARQAAQQRQADLQHLQARRIDAIGFCDRQHLHSARRC